MQREPHARAWAVRALSMTSRACDHRSSEQRRENKVSGGSCARGRATGTAARDEGAGTGTATASVTGVTSIHPDVTDWLARSIGAALATWVTVQQHAARKTVSGAAGPCFDWPLWVVQQHAERVTLSYMHLYQDAVTLDGTRARTSKIGTTRRTRANHTLLRVAGNRRSGYRPLCHRHSRGSRCFSLRLQRGSPVLLT